MIGTTLSHYRITEKLGQGGMGVVYKGTDTRLDRTVAIKVLPAAALASKDDRERFYREAKAAAQLHHPNIASVFEIDEAAPRTTKEIDEAIAVGENGNEVDRADGLRPFIAMEYIDGESLSARVAAGPLKLDEAVRLATQIASALEAAHEKNIVHRDIKSANVMLTKKGDAKVLDFGLAKTAQSTMLTRMGSTLGTVAYMSPEQARGEEVDQRTDLWALGIVLYEMIAGRLPFSTDYEQAAVYSILNEDPEPLTALRTGVPMELERIANKLLTKDAARRYQSAAGLIADLKGVDFAGSNTNISSTSQYITTGSLQHEEATEAKKGGFSSVIVGASVLTALILGALGGRFVLNSPDAAGFQAPVQRITTSFDGLNGFSSPVLSPDERYLVFSAFDSVDNAAYVYDFESGKIVSRYPQRRTMYPDISPDGRRVVLSEIGADMQTFLLPDGNPSVISRQGEWAYWESNESLVFRLNGDLYRMSASGGEPTLVAEPDSTAGFNRLWPSYIFEGGKKALITAGGVGAMNRSILFMDLESSDYHIVQKNAHQAKFLNSGHLVFVQGGGLSGQLVVQPFDKDKGTLYGLPASLNTDEIDWLNWNVSEEGIAVYASNTRITGTISWMDMNGDVSEQDILPEDAYITISLSPSGDKALVTRLKESASFASAQITSLDSQNPPFLISGDIVAGTETWSADGSTVYFSNSGQSGTLSTMYKVSVDNGGLPEQIFQRQGAAIQRISVSPDETFILYDESLTDNLFRYSVADQSVSPWIVTSSLVERNPTISPSGWYVAYSQRPQTRGVSSIVVSDIEGNEVWHFRDPASHLVDPQWSPDGNYLFFSKSSGDLVRVRVSTDGPFSVEGYVQTVGNIEGLIQSYSVHPDGKRIMMLSVPESVSDVKVNFIFNFGEEARRLAPTR